MATRNKFDFGRLVDKMEGVKKTAPILIANKVKRIFTDSFQKQGWDGKPWAQVKRRIQGTREYKYPKTKGLSRRKSPILVRAGHLRRSVNNSIRAVGWQKIVFGSDRKYAEYLNEGTPKMKRRQFMGHSKMQDRIVTEILHDQVNKIFK